MKVVFFYRHESCGFSIQRVFNTLIQKLKTENKVNVVTVVSARSMPWDILRNSYYVYKQRDPTEINHITGHIHDVVLGLVGCKVVLTIHDLVFLDNVTNPIKRFYKWFFWLYLPIKIANRVTCISNHTRKNVLKYVKTNKLKVIHNPVDGSYEYVPKVFVASKPVILHVGTGWNKNLKRVIDSLADIPCHLRILGKIDKEIIAKLALSKVEYSNVHGLSDEDVRREYIRCDIVSFPSLYEGFGMPIIEGQATGRVVLTSSIDPLIEVSGDAVCYVNPEEVSDIRAGFKKVIDDDNYRNYLIKRGLKNAERFNSEYIADQYLDVYKEFVINE